MSHIAVTKCESKDLDALETAAARCGGELVRNQTSFAWWGTSVGRQDVDGIRWQDFGKCSHAIRVHGTVGVSGSVGPWEVGVLDTPDGFKLMFDNYGQAGHELEAHFGKGLDVLRNSFAGEVLVKELGYDGYVVKHRTVNADGTVELELED